MPGWFEPVKRDIIDRLEEIRMAAPGRIQVEYVDPAKNEKVREELRADDLEFTPPSVEKDKLTYSTLFTTLRVTYADKPSQLIRVVQRSEDLEYQLASKVVELTLKDKPVIAIQTPRPDQPMMPMMNRMPSSGFEWFLRQDLPMAEFSKKFDVRPTELTEASPIPKGAKMLVLIRPKDLGERARYEVAKFLAEGGQVWLLAVPFKVHTEMPGASWNVEKTPTGLEDYLKECGVTLSTSLLCDERNIQLPILNLFTRQVRVKAYPFFIEIAPSTMDQESPITRYLPSLVMPFAAEVKLDEEKLKAAGLKHEILASTSPNSWTQELGASFTEKQAEAKKAGNEPNRPVFVRLSGQFPFPWEGQTAPAWDKKDEAKGEEKKDEAKKDEAKKGDEKAAVEKKPGVLLIWSAPDAFHVGYLENERVGDSFKGNISVMPNVVESSALGTDLGSLRAKRFETRTIERLEGRDLLRNLVKLGLIAGVPLALAVFGLSRWGLRRAGQIRHERSFAQTTGPSSFTP